MDNVDWSVPSDRIKKLLRERGITQASLANMLGVTEQNVRQLLNKPSMRTDTLKRIADILEIPVWQLFISPEEVIAQYGPELPPSSPQACPKSAQSLPQADAEREKYLADVIDSLKETISAQAKTIAVLSERVEQLEARLK